MTRFQEIARIDEELYQFNVHGQNEKSAWQRMLWQVDLLVELHILLHPVEWGEEKVLAEHGVFASPDSDFMNGIIRE